MKLREIQVHNYRAVVDISIEAHDYTLLVGANNAGKSTVGIPAPRDRSFRPIVTDDSGMS